MKFVYAGIFAAILMVSGAQAQGMTTIRGEGAFCLVDNAVANCSFADAQACQKEIRNAGEARKPVCIARGEVK
jgi:hypothetical protein